MFRRILITLLSCLGSLAQAAEVDSFTQRHALDDSALMLDQVVNVWLEEALIEANKPPLLEALSSKKEMVCDRSRLLEAVRARLAGYLVGQVERFANQSTAIDKIKTPFEQSIYRDFEFTESPAVALTGRMAVLLRLGDVMLGSDKLGHFFTEGYSYFDLYINVGEKQAIDYGHLTESSIFGLMTTGIFSWADQAANLNGLRFWNALLGLRPDPLTQQKPVPYMVCENGQWHRQRAFHWTDYVDPTWDEALNCNTYKDQQLVEKVSGLIAERSGGRHCPLDKVDKTALQQKYGRLLPFVYNENNRQLFDKAMLPQLEAYWQMLVQMAPFGRLTTSDHEVKTNE